MTHTYAILEVPPAVYQIIRGLLRDAAYAHAFQKKGDGEIIDMHGIALRAEVQAQEPASEEPIEVVFATGKFTEADKRIWARRVRDVAAWRGVTYSRLSVDPARPGCVLYEGWRTRPDDLGDVRWPASLERSEGVEPS